MISAELSRERSSPSAMFDGVAKLATRLKWLSCARAPPATSASTEVRLVSRVMSRSPEWCFRDTLWRHPVTDA